MPSLLRHALLASLLLVRLCALVPEDLRTDRVAAPLGVDSERPLLSWRHRDEGVRGAAQSAWQVLVATQPGLLQPGKADLWDSGQVSGDSGQSASYSGRPLASFQQAWWTVRTWDQQGRPGPWAEPAGWTMGALSPSDWAASWITNPELAPLARRALGYHSPVSASPDTDKWLALDLGAPLPVDEVRLHALRHSVPDGFGFPVRFRIELSDTADFAAPRVLLDHSAADFPNPWATTVTARGDGLPARHVRIRVLRMRTEDDGSCRFALSQVVVNSGGRNVAAGAAVSSDASLEQHPWSAASVVDGLGVPGRDPLANSTVLLRRDFVVRPGLRRALLLCCGPGHHLALLNGRRVSRDFLSTAWTRHDRLCLYDTHEVSALLAPGANTAAFTLAGGFYNVQQGRYVKLTTAFRPPSLIALLRLEYEDGSVETLGTDGSWQAARGPAVFSNLYSGEDYDARLEPSGWDRPGGSPAHWLPALVVQGPGGALKGASESAPPLREQERLRGASLAGPPAGPLVFDLGQNAAIVPRIRVRGPAGATVRIIPSELLSADGRADQRSVLHGGSSYCSYTLAGTGSEEVWQPAFHYHGARYLQIELSAPPGQALPELLSTEGLVVHSDSPAAGSFECSIPLLNRIRSLVRWAQRSNAMHVFTDCPHRERLGWIEQTYLNGPALRYEFDFSRLFRKGLNDMALSQTEQGLIPGINPEYVVFRGAFRDSPEWGSAIIFTAWQQYEWTGDLALLERHYPAMRRYLAYLTSRADRHILSHGLGDWYDIGPKRPGLAQLTPVPLTATATYQAAAATLARIAERLGRPSEAEELRTLASSIRDAFNARFLDQATASYGSGSQTSNAMPLALGLVPREFESRVFARLVADLHSRGNAVTAGDIGYRYLLRALADRGRSDLILAINNQTDKPGYGYQLARGCTSLPESWTAEPNSSQNHFMLGQITEWFYGDLAGIQPDDQGPGFARLRLRPTPLAGLDWVRASLDTPRGLVRSEWSHKEGRFEYDVSIPPNVVATVRIPRLKGTEVVESQAPAEQRPGVSLLSSDSNSATFTVTSGKYRFVSTIALD